MNVESCLNASHENFQFPAYGDVPKLNLGCGRDIRDGWVNVDAYAPGALKIDITQTPWQFDAPEMFFDDESFSLIYASHILEHVPVVIDNGRDVLFRIFDEMHRVLKPGGICVIRVPIGWSGCGLHHPQHYRQFHATHFKFLLADHWEPYYVERHWSRVSVIYSKENGASQMVLDGWFPIGKSRIGLTSHLTIRFPFLRRLLTAPGEMIVTLYKE